MKKLGLAGKKGNTFFHGNGCHKCNSTGYKGRLGIFEILPVESAIKELIRTDASEGVIKKEAAAKGMTSLRDDGIKKALDGLTTIEELMRVLFVELGDDIIECPHCAEKLHENMSACPKCEYKLKDICPSCKRDIDSTWLFCSFCGGKLKLTLPGAA